MRGETNDGISSFKSKEPAFYCKSEVPTAPVADQPYMVWVSCASSEQAKAIAEAVVTERLAACAQVMGRGQSIYMWQGCLQLEEESFLLIKTLGRQLKALHQRVVALHSYEVPEWLVLPVVEVSPAYLAWMRQNVD